MHRLSKLILLLVLLFAVRAHAADTFCASDDDHNGTVDFWCAGNDADADGVPASRDCDNNNRHVRDNGDWYAKDTNHDGVPDDGAGVLRQCKADGTGWSATTDFNATGLDEHTSSGRAFYVDCSTGSDSNTCTWGSPCRTAKNFSRYYNVGSRPGTYVRELQEGDVVYWLNCPNITSADNYSTGDGSYPTAYIWTGNVNTASPHYITLKAYPGHESWLGGPGNATINMSGSAIRTDGTKRVKIRGLEQKGTGNWLIWPSEHNPDYSRIEDVYVHGARGNQSSNVCGIQLHSGIAPVVIGSDFWDNYDATAYDGGCVSENNADVVNFDTPNASVLYSHFTHDALCKGMSFKHKHCKALGQSNPVDTFVGNVVLNASTNNYSASVGFCSGITATNNRIGGPTDYTAAFSMKDWGGDPDFRGNSTIANNYIAQHRLLYYAIDTNYNAATATSCTDCNIEGSILIEKNVIKTTTTSSLYDLCHYGVDSLFTRIITGGKLTIRDNSYDTTSFDTSIFGATGGGAGCQVSGGTFASGSSYADYTSWTGAGYDSGSYKGTVTLNSSHQVTSGGDTTRGWSLAAGTPTPTPTPTPTATATSTPTATPTVTPTYTPGPTTGLRGGFSDRTMGRR